MIVKPHLFILFHILSSGVSHDRDFSHNKRLLKPTSTLPPSDSSVDW